MCQQHETCLQCLSSFENCKFVIYDNKKVQCMEEEALFRGSAIEVRSSDLCSFYEEVEAPGLRSILGKFLILLWG